MNKTRFNEFLHELRAPTPPLPEYDRDKVDEAVLALPYLVLHQPGPYLAWKGFEWAALDRLHTKGLIGDLKNKNTSVALTDDGVADAVAAFQRLFSVDGDERWGMCLIVPVAGLLSSFCHYLNHTPGGNI